LQVFDVGTGNSGIGVRSEGAAAATTEASDPAQGTGGCTHSVVVAMLRCRREFHVDSDLEAAPAAVQVHYTVSASCNCVDFRRSHVSLLP